MNLSKFNELDFSEIGDWPAVAKAIAVLLIFAAVVGGGYWFFTKDKLLQLEEFEKKEPELKTTFEVKQAKAENLESYKKQMEEIQLSFGSMLRQLPSKTEVADLLVDISQTGLSSGLEFEFFKPGSELPADFYAELPIQIRVIGNYHQFGEFVSKVAALPRIVTLHNFAIENQDKESGKLAMDITAKTYRYFSEDENTTATRN
ncbi:type 4a pilus biogenesis protein PilO [Nitrosococcus watsonii]|uniref:Pilus assembly protein PilO n=1 Tax=Nitrosococcus watsoni (strain C-113) TaxID=105559 RepID=D8K9M8_NITWC|nr:type 4a pilus biogenesis protein PilO [Nitrosococcus watsonii]ADJ27317.1 Pilus assembly protein PilO [Nitrosococcus watsonii C-113]